MDIDALARAKYLSLTTFKRDGSAVATPVWLVREDDALLVITQGSSAKVRLPVGLIRAMAAWAKLPSTLSTPGLARSRSR